MFGLNLWARPFLPTAPGTMGMDNTGGLPRGHPALGLGAAPTYLLPGLSAEKSAASTMHSPFAPGSLFMYRPDSMLHPHMLRVNVDHGGLHLGAQGAEAERGLSHPLRDPHGSDSGSVESYPSAFQPTKRVRLAAGEENGHSRTPSRHSDSGGHKHDDPCGSSYYGDRTAVGSGADDGGRSATTSRPSPGSSSVRSTESARGSPQDVRHTAGGLSPSRSETRTPGGPPRCPVCGIGLSPGEIDSHYSMELDRLRVLARMERGENAAEGVREADLTEQRRSSSANGLSSTSNSAAGGSPSASAAASGSGAMTVSESRYETYLKIRNNRHVRLCAKTRGRRKRPSDTPPHDGIDPRDDPDHFSPGQAHHPHPALQQLHHPHHPHHPHMPHQPPPPPPPPQQHPNVVESEAHHLQQPPTMTSLAAGSRPPTSILESLSSNIPSSSYQSPIYQSAAHHSPNYQAAAAAAAAAAAQRSPNYPSAAQHSPNYHPNDHRSPMSYQQPGRRSPHSYQQNGHRSPSFQPPSQRSPTYQAAAAAAAAAASSPPRSASPTRASPVASPPPGPVLSSSANKPHESDDEDEFIRVDSPRPESVIVNVCSVDPPSTTPPINTNGTDRPASPHLTIPASHLARQPVSIKCQVCQGAYSRPVTSVSCWHVHCEDCWIKTVGNKRLCPQCKSVSSTSDLRKVYI